MLLNLAWQGYIIGCLSKYCNFDSEDDCVRKNAIACLEEEMRIANHLNLTAFMLPVHSLKMENLSRVLNDFLVHRYASMNVSSFDLSHRFSNIPFNRFLSDCPSVLEIKTF